MFMEEYVNKFSKLSCLIFLAASSYGCKKVDVVDQEQTGSIDASFSIGHFAPVGQSFVPSATKLNYVKLNLLDNGGFDGDHVVYLNIRESTIDGDVIGVSETLILEDCFNFEEGPGCGIGGGYTTEVRFGFVEDVVLVPDSTYVLEIVPGGLSSNLNVGNSHSDLYELGGYFKDGQENIADLWFEEGYTSLQLSNAETTLEEAE